MAGWTKAWRKELTSNIWEMPPLYHRVFIFLRHNVTTKPYRLENGMMLKPGQYFTTMTRIAQGVGWIERGVEKVPNRKTIKDILGWLEAQNTIICESNRLGTLITLTNWLVYNGPYCEWDNQTDNQTDKSPDNQTDTEQEAQEEQEKPTAAWGDVLRKKAKEKRAFILDKVCPWMDDALFDIEVEKMVEKCRRRTTDPGLRVISWFQMAKKPKGGLADSGPLPEKFTDRWKRGEI